MEELEDVPWSRLVADQAPDNSTRSLVIAAAIVAAVVVGIGGARLLFGGSDPAPLPPLAVDATTSTTSATTTTQPLGVVVSEADLMALVPSPDDLAEVRLRAEWFVADYFTVDPQLSDPAAVEGALALVDPVLPHDLDQPASSYVDFARSGTVTQVDAATHAVEVVMRRVVRGADGVTRLPAERVVVIVGFDSGGTVVLDLPGLDTLPVGAPGEATRRAIDHVDVVGMTWPMVEWAAG